MLVAPAVAFLGGEDLEAGGPPTGEDGLGELFGEALFAHLVGESVVVVGDGAEGHGGFVAGEVDEGVVHGGAAVVGGAADGADVDHLAAVGEAAVPGDARVGDEEEIRPVGVEEVGEEGVGAGGLPEEFVDSARGAVGEEDVAAAPLAAEVGGEVPEPVFVFVGGVGQGVVVADLGEVVVSGVGVAAGAVVEAVADGVIVVALHHEEVLGVAKEGEDPVRVRAEAAHVAEAVDLVGAAAAGVVEGGLQAQVVIVDAAEEGDQVRHVTPSTKQV